MDEMSSSAYKEGLGRRMKTFLCHHTTKDHSFLPDTYTVQYMHASVLIETRKTIPEDSPVSLKLA